MAALAASSERPVTFSAAERAAILAQGPWPPPQRPDPSNRYSGNPDAIALGRRLFFDTRLSIDGRQSCATCHDPAKSFADGKTRSVGRALVDRNAIALANLRLNRWFGWAGAADSLWAQSIHPIVEEKELGLTAAQLRERCRRSRHSRLPTHTCSAPLSRTMPPSACWSTSPRRWPRSRRRS